jgi:hypothetical protein
MLIDVWHGRLKQFGELHLRQPKRLVLEAALDASPAIFGLVQDHLGERRFVGHQRFLAFPEEGAVEQRPSKFVDRDLPRRP